MDLQLWYLMVQKKDDGCPYGFTNVILSKGFAADIHKQPYGQLPWYSIPRRRGAKPPPLPQQGLCLISLDKRYRFDIRSIGGIEKMFAMSPRFKRCIDALASNFEEPIAAPLVDKLNNRLAAEDYFVARCKRLPVLEAIDEPGSRLIDVPGGKSIQRLQIKADLGLDLFALDAIPTTQDSLICSQRAVQALQSCGILGITFVPLADVNWPKAPNPAEPLDLFNPDADLLMMV